MDFSKIDKECIPLVQLFNKEGLTTTGSCSGHGKHWFIINFDEELENHKMIDFIDKYSTKHNHSPFLGSFNLWTRKRSGKVVQSWVYVAHSIAFANIDFSRMTDEKYKKQY